MADGRETYQVSSQNSGSPSSCNIPSDTTLQMSENHRVDTECKWEITHQLRTKLMCDTES